MILSNESLERTPGKDPWRGSKWIESMKTGQNKILMTLGTSDPVAFRFKFENDKSILFKYETNSLKFVK